MPIYEYLCLTCGGEFELMQKVSDPSPRRHSCSPKSRVKRKLSLTAFQLKGGGWYAEGYSKGNGASAKEKPGASTEGKKEAESKKEPAATKSETKSDSGSSGATAPAATKSEKPTSSPST